MSLEERQHVVVKQKRGLKKLQECFFLLLSYSRPQGKNVINLNESCYVKSFRVKEQGTKFKP